MMKPLKTLLVDLLTVPGNRMITGSRWVRWAEGLARRIDLLKEFIMIQVKRVYEAPSNQDGFRILVDRLWPRGLTQEKAKIDLWLKEIAPSNELRKWYGHDPAKWPEFKKRYFTELASQPEAVRKVVEQATRGKVTFLYSSKETEINNAFALKEFLASADI